jgi:hypothetical protein
VTEREACRWLIDAGLTPHGDRWIVDEPDLGQLRQDEVRSLDDAPED